MGNGTREVQRGAYTCPAHKWTPSRLATPLPCPQEDCIAPLLACRLIALNKNPGVRPSGVHAVQTLFKNNDTEAMLLVDASPQCTPGPVYGRRCTPLPGRD